MTGAEGDATRFVGRERELEALLGVAASAARGRSATILIESSSGYGATRLVDEALLRLVDPAVTEGPPAAVLRSDALPAWRGAPYAPFRVALERLFADREPQEVDRLLGPGGDLLLPLVPRLAERIGAAGHGPASRERLADRTNEAFRGLLGRLAATGPVALVVEDLHVLDAASRSLLAFLARTIGERPVLLVGSYQPEALGRGHPFRATLDAIASGPRPLVRLALPPLDRAALSALIVDRTGEAPSAPTLLLVAERSGGNPLIAEEVLRARRELSGSSLSAPLDQLVVTRAARRSPECRRVLRILSIATGPLTPGELTVAAATYDAGIGRSAPRSSGHPRRRGGLWDGDLAAGVDEAIEHGFVVGAPPRRGSGRARGQALLGPLADAGLRVRHELVATALAADLLPGPRRSMRAAVAVALEDHPAEAGRLWQRAHEPARALEAETAAAMAAEAVGAAADALVHLEGSIELGSAPITAGTLGRAAEVDLLVRAAEAAAAAGDAPRAEAFIEAAVARHPDRTDRVALAQLTDRLGSFRLARGDHLGAVAAFERALELLGTAPSLERTKVLAILAQVRMLDGVFSEAASLAEEAVAVADAVGPAAVAWRGHATCTLGVVDGWHGRTASAIRRLEEALAVAVAEHRLDDAFRARANLATMLDLEGRREEAVEVSGRGIEAAEAAGLEVVHGNLLRGSAVDALVTLGRWDEARAMAERALDWAPSGIPFVNAAIGLAIVETETTAGDAAARLLGRLFLELETIPDVQFAVPAYQAAASLALWRGDLGDARRAIEAAWSRVRDSEDWAYAARAAAAVLAVADARARAGRQRKDLAEIATARAWGDQVLRRAAWMVDTSRVPPEARSRQEAEADLATARAFAARLHGSDDPATWAGVAARWRAVGRPYEAARALHHQVEAHLEAGAQAGTRREGRDEAREPLAESAAMATRLGAIPLLRALADLAERARIPLDEATVAALAAAAAPPPGVEAEPPRPEVSRGPAPAEADRRTAASFGLSQREQEVLAEIVAGRTNREIGERLYISDKTVGVHVGNILAKLGVGGRVEAATVALRLGLVDDRLERTRKPGPSGPGFRARRRGGAA